MNGDCFRPDVPADVLNAEARRLGVAGFVGIIQAHGDPRSKQVFLPWGTETAEGTAAMIIAADVLRAALQGDPQTGPIN